MSENMGRNNMRETMMETWNDSDGLGYSVPVTLRQIEAHRIDLNATSGLDEQEHAEMLDVAGDWRVRFGYRLSDGGDETRRVLELESYEVAWRFPTEGARWASALRLYSHPSGNAQRLHHLHNLQRVEALLDSVVPADDLRIAWEAAEAEVSTWVYVPDDCEADQ
jgi:hypothetical protein